MSLSLVVTGGEAPPSRPPFEYDHVIAADSGYDTAVALSLRPDTAVGDFDSTHMRQQLLADGFVPLPKDKDWSDTELALKALDGADYDLLGGGGGRIDHLLGILALFEHYPLPRFWFLREDILIRVEGRMSFSLGKGACVSVIAAPGRRCHVKSLGLVWPLDDIELSSAYVSLSNRSREDVVVLETDQPVFLRISSEYLNRLESMVE